MLGLLAESDVTSGVTTSSVALTCTAPYTALRMLFVTLGTFVRLSSEVAVLGRLAIGTAGNTRRSGCQEVRVFCVFSTLFFFDSRCVVLDMMWIDGRAARGSGRPSWWLIRWHKHLQ